MRSCRASGNKRLHADWRGVGSGVVLCLPECLAQRCGAVRISSILCRDEAPIPSSTFGQRKFVHCKLQYIHRRHTSTATGSTVMVSTRPKVKTATMTLRVDPKIKAAVEAAAQRDHRSITSLIEVLILNHCRSVGLNPTRTSEERNQ